MDRKIDLNHSSHVKLINVLRLKKLHYLINPYKKLVFLIKGNSQKKIFKSIKETKTKEFIEMILTDYFNKYNVTFEKKERKIYQDKTVNERVKKYRDNIKKTKKHIGFYIDLELYEKIQQFKKRNPSTTYETLLNLALLH